MAAQAQSTKHLILDFDNTRSTMSIVRAILVSTQAFGYWVASTPPNRTPEKARFDGSHPLAARMATGVFKVGLGITLAWRDLAHILSWAPCMTRLVQVQAFIVLVCALAEVLLAATENMSSVTAHQIRPIVCPYNPTIPPSSALGSLLRATPLLILGVISVVCGAMLRLQCFRVLGKLFTFDLTILPAHKLITWGPYSYVRHPAYSGSLMLFFGIGLVNLTGGSWLAECGILGHGVVGMGIRLAIFGMLMSGWLAVGVHRARAEDAELGKHFGEEWDRYAEMVGWWFAPGGL